MAQAKQSVHSEPPDEKTHSVEYLISNGKAPVKKEYIRESLTRNLLPSGTVSAANSKIETSSNLPSTEITNPTVATESNLENIETTKNVGADLNSLTVQRTDKKSKRQMKRDRVTEKKTSANICAAVSRTGKIESCPYANSCRFNHDIDSFLASKPKDLPGICPFVKNLFDCPFGLKCRFYFTHKKRIIVIKENKEINDDTNEKNKGNGESNRSNEQEKENKEKGEGVVERKKEDMVTDAENGGVKEKGNGKEVKTEEKEDKEEEKEKDSPFEDELNYLSKELQKQLWKNTVSTPRAEEQLRRLGLKSKPKGRSEKDRNTEEEDKIMEEDKNTEEKDKNMEEEDKNTEEKDKNDHPPTEEIDREAKKRRLDEDKKETVSEEKDTNKQNSNENVHVILSDRNEIAPLPASDAGVKNDGADSKTGKSKNDDVDDILMVNSDAKKSVDSFRYDADSGLVGADEDSILKTSEKKRLNFKNQLYLAPLTTVGNLPFRKICKNWGADVTCGEMAMCVNLLQGQSSEWALLRKDKSESVFGVQICGAHPDHLAKTAEIIQANCQVDFIDINMGCPIDLVVKKGAGSCLLTRPQKMEQCVTATSASIDCPLTVKLRTGYFDGKNCAHNMLSKLWTCGAQAITVHGRTRQQRYSKTADWDYIALCAQTKPAGLQLIGNGDIMSFSDYNKSISNGVDACMIARGALIKPWIFTEIKEQREWDISSAERLEMLKNFSNFGMLHWGSDTKGVETTRRFLLEWLSYLHRYIPVGLLEVVPQKMNWRPPSFFGRNELETMMASDSAADWVRLSEMVLGPAPPNFVFTPKHKSNAYDKAENG